VNRDMRSPTSARRASMPASFLRDRHTFGHGVQVLLGDGLDCAVVAVDGCLQAPVPIVEFLDVLGGAEWRRR
jgi:hypothetical protein